jgi:hypothetical protein
VDGFTGQLVNQSCADNPQTRTFVVIDDPTAYDWLNNTPEGNAWLRDRGVEPPVAPPPTEECDPNQPRPYVVISFPQENLTVEGVLTVRGTITMPNFSRFEVRYGIGHQPGAFSDPLIIQTTQLTEADSLIGQFDTRSLQNGPYTIRLVIIDASGNSVNRDIHINVNNPQQPPAQPLFPTPTLAPTQPFVIPTPTLAPTLTPG